MRSRSRAAIRLSCAAIACAAVSGCGLNLDFLRAPFTTSKTEDVAAADIDSKPGQAGTGARNTAPGETAPTRQAALQQPGSDAWASIREALAAGTLTKIEPGEGDVMAMAEADLPILIPAPMAEGQYRISARQKLYLVRGQIFGIQAEMTGSRLVQSQAGAALAENLQANIEASGDGILISRGDGFTEAAFNRYGAAYTLSLYCEGADLPICSEDAEVRALIGTLVLLNSPPEPDGPGTEGS